MSTSILGISAYYHDSAAALLRDGEIVAAAQEERFSRRKHDASFPRHAVEFCLTEAGVNLREVDHVAFYDKPLIKFERLLETYLSYAPKGFRSFVASMPVWLKEKLYLKNTLRRELADLGNCRSKDLPPLLFADHHHSHAASAFYFSPFRRAAILCLDGVGEWATTSVWQACGSRIEPLWQIDFPHSLGLLYSAFTYHAGFRVNSGEHKLMGLAPYGEPKYVDSILSELLDLKADGTFRMNMRYFEYCTGLRMTNANFDRLFDGPPRMPESDLTQREMDIAASIQRVTEEIILRLANTVHRETSENQLCLAGGVALNCVANGRLLREGPFENIWIQPAAGDAGGALGAAAIGWYEHGNRDREVGDGTRDSMRGSYLGPQYTNAEITKVLDGFGATYEALDDVPLVTRLAELLHEGKVIGWFQGRMEFGPRALGARSILGDARSDKMQSLMNRKIKFRESFRPFAPSVLADKASDYFELHASSPYMLLVAPVREALPAITHVDYSARVQTVHKSTNPRYYQLLEAFEKLTGCAVLINTSFNVRGEPIVCTPADAYRCFMRTEMDYLVLENCLLAKSEQPPWHEDASWRDSMELD